MSGIAAVAALAVAVPFADAYVYWGTSSPNGKIGRAQTNGTSPNAAFLPIPADPGNGSPCGIAANATHLFFANQDNDSIGRANLDGTGLDPSFISLPSGASPCGVAVNSTHVFWADLGHGKIGRANLDGTGVNNDLVSGLTSPCGVAVNSSFVYWGHEPPGTTIGRATVNGASPDDNFITGQDSPCGVAVNATHIYWGNRSFVVGAPDNTIGRAEIDGSPVSSSIVSTDNNPTGVALNSTHVFWANDAPSTGPDDKIGRANLDGTAPNQDFIVVGESLLGVAVDDFPHSSATVVACSPSAVAVTQPATCTATVSDTATTAAPAVPAGTVTFSSGGGSFQPAACALTAIGAKQSSCTVSFAPAQTGSQPINASYAGSGLHGSSGASTTVAAAVLTLGAVEKDKKHGTAKLTVNAPGAGSVDLTGKDLKDKHADTVGPGELTLKVKPKGKKKDRLKENGKVKVKPEVTFTPSGGGDVTTATTKVKLVKR